MGKVVDGIEWEGNGHSLIRPGKVNAEQVAVIRKLKNHTHSNSDNWEVEVNGVTFETRFRYVRDAQEFAAKKVFQNR